MSGEKWHNAKYLNRLPYAVKTAKTGSMNKPLTFFMGLAAGGLGVYFWQQAVQSHTVKTPAAHVEVEVARLQAQLAERQQEIKKLTEAAAPGKGEAHAAQEPADTRTAEEIAKMEAEQAKHQEQMKARVDKLKKKQEARMLAKVNEKLSALTAKLNLTPEQTEKLRADLLALEKQHAISTLMGMEDGAGADSARDTEKMMMERILNPEAEDKAKDEAILATLSPEQQKAYQSFQQEQRSNKLEVAVNKEFLQLQGAITLTDAQKDQVFAQISKLTQDEIDRPISGFLRFIELEPQGMKEIETKFGQDKVDEVKGLMAEQKARQARRTEALKGILTEEQMKVYEGVTNRANFNPMEAMGEMGMDMEAMMDVQGVELETEDAVETGDGKAETGTTQKAPSPK